MAGVLSPSDRGGPATFTTAFGGIPLKERQTAARFP
jgi:hypothetical protein